METTPPIVIIAGSAGLFFCALLCAIVLLLRSQNSKLNNTLALKLSEQAVTLSHAQINLFNQLQTSVRQNLLDVQTQMQNSLTQSYQFINQQLERINSDVDKRLSENFEKTSATFGNVLERLAIIDQAQQQLQKLSSNVVSLQEILIDKRSRGAFGEVQLEYLIKNILPSTNYTMQFTLENGTRADCMLHLPQPTGNIAIDSKFPLETYQQLTAFEQNTEQRKILQQKFRQDIKKHINDIADKYIIPGETTDAAILFLPAEAIFAEIHHNFSDLVTLSHQRRVWLTSPTTMMAILTTASSVIKDHARQKHIKIIQLHLSKLGSDFNRFQERMDKLARHIEQANDDVKNVHTSAQKISSRFQQIEKVDVQVD